MSSRQIFPLADIAQIDSVLFKAAFPEWPTHVATEPLAAGLHTRTESIDLVEIAQEAALRTGKHVWVDGSLRDAGWYSGVFARIRKLYPDYQLAILYVTANESQVAARVKRRAEATGRHVPDGELRDSLARVFASVAALAAFRALSGGDRQQRRGARARQVVRERHVRPRGRQVGRDPFARPHGAAARVRARRGRGAAAALRAAGQPGQTRRRRRGHPDGQARRGLRAPLRAVTAVGFERAAASC
jgi:hypothetical protein